MSDTHGPAPFDSFDHSLSVCQRELREYCDDILAFKAPFETDDFCEVEVVGVSLGDYRDKIQRTSVGDLMLRADDFIGSFEDFADELPPMTPVRDATVRHIGVWARGRVLDASLFVADGAGGKDPLDAGEQPPGFWSRQLGINFMLTAGRQTVIEQISVLTSNLLPETMPTLHRQVIFFDSEAEGEPLPIDDTWRTKSRDCTGQHEVFSFLAQADRLFMHRAK